MVKAGSRDPIDSVRLGALFGNSQLSLHKGNAAGVEHCSLRTTGYDIWQTGLLCWMD